MIDLFDSKQSWNYFSSILERTGISREKILQLSETATKNLKEKQPTIPELDQKWYYSLRELNEKDYSVYSTEEYLAELWACWIVYSRKYLREIKRAKSFPPHGFMVEFSDVKLVVDLGCGLGMTTAALKQMFPKSRIIGTNLDETPQMEISKSISNDFGFELVSCPSQIDGKADLVFSSEYFEHFEEPVKHLKEIIDFIEPKRMLIANAFSGDSIGHFDNYIVNGIVIPSNMMNKFFNSSLRFFGYRKIKTKLWNNRPSYWVFYRRGLLKL